MEGEVGAKESVRAVNGVRNRPYRVSSCLLNCLTASKVLPKSAENCLLVRHQDGSLQGCEKREWERRIQFNPINLYYLHGEIHFWCQK